MTTRFHWLLESSDASIDEKTREGKRECTRDEGVFRELPIRHIHNNPQMPIAPSVSDNILPLYSLHLLLICY